MCYRISLMFVRTDCSDKKALGRLAHSCSGFAARETKVAKETGDLQHRHEI